MEGQGEMMLCKEKPELPREREWGFFLKAPPLRSWSRDLSVAPHSPLLLATCTGFCKYVHELTSLVHGHEVGGERGVLRDTFAKRPPTEQ